MTAALSLAVLSLVLFLALSRVFALESNLGKRFFLQQPRMILDRSIEKGTEMLDRNVTYISRYIITLSWYYSLHAFLKVVLQSLAGIYFVVEKILHRNRDRARQIRIERKRATSHLTEIADHKAKTALTPSEKAKRKEKALRGD